MGGNAQGESLTHHGSEPAAFPERGPNMLCARSRVVDLASLVSGCLVTVWVLPSRHGSQVSLECLAVLAEVVKEADQLAGGAEP